MKENENDKQPSKVSTPLPHREGQGGGSVGASSSINQLFYSYLGAYILVALSGCLGNVVDGIIVGNLISEDGVSAINLAKPINQFIFTLHLLINAGAGMLVAYALGQKNIGEARRFFSRALMLSTGIGVLLSIFGGVLFPDQTARMLCSNEHILPLARDYMQVLLLGNPAFIIMWGLSTMVGVDGKPKLVSAAVIIDNAVNLLLDIVFIQCFGWGIIGSSAATVVGHLVGIAILLSHWWNPANRRLTLTAFAVCMNLLQVYNLFLSGTCQTLQSLGAIQVGKKNEEGLHTILRRAFRFITAAMAVTCILVWAFPESIARLFGAEDATMLTECSHALRIFALSFIPFCYIYVIMIVYKLYGQHRMALFISFALSLTVIPVLWLVARIQPSMLWYSYLIAYLIEAVAIYTLHRMNHVELKLKI